MTSSPSMLQVSQNLYQVYFEYPVPVELDLHSVRSSEILHKSRQEREQWI